MADNKSTISSLMTEDRVFDPKPEFSEKAHVKSPQEHTDISKSAEDDFEGFWAEKADQLTWFKKWDKVFTWDKEKVDIKWFVGGKLNVSYNCLDRHAESDKKDKTAILWESDGGQVRKYSFAELKSEVSRFANVLKGFGVVKGDRVCLYMGMVPELAIAMLACARVGAVHSIVFGGFSAESLRDRILDSKCKVLITADGSKRGGKVVPLKGACDEALEGVDCIEKVIVYKRADNDVNMKEGRDIWWHDATKDVSDDCPAEEMDAEDPLFILYTSGTTGKPKGVLHTTGGYLTYVTATTRWVFDIKDDDVYWCTADIGWITGHSYIVYGPLALGATTMMFEGIPTYPEPDRFWDLVEKHKVSIFYTAPTAIRAIMRNGDEWVTKHDLSSLRLLGTVGEPINPEAWMWYHKIVGGERCPIVDTWWQTETGGILITPLPGAVATKPGSATKPFPGVFPKVLREDGSEADVNEGGYLVLTKPWPSIMRTVYGDHKRFIDTYWSKYHGMYFTGDAARRDKDGYFWIMGRVDDVVNVSGHRIGTAEVESALVSHPSVAEAAVVPMPHEIKGQGLYAFVTLKKGIDKTDELKAELIAQVKKEIGPIAKPDKIQFADSLPKTRSGKIMRRILKAIAEGKDDVGNTTTLADPSVVDVLIKERN
ncbi:acetate--CoA ligase [Candidatus Woesearchaeota archaeon CG11_big_fil_rev_8_21_14_0_20_43_8]|nr:MAG: acetate--CoA ligase [Candidatus Woesearchaeota archaeon CG11_big_fil_rev_8_21_14_0_20_43_8]PIO05561.1 MAG: acetate--CoA ligase [Candidatus Woesearchaeota archaeon CG08_land_8_20_14_0_20_43_7]